MEWCRVLVRRVTAVFLATSAVLILPSLAGLGSSVHLTVALVVTGLVLVLLRPQLSALPTVLDIDLGRYAPDLWIAPFLAASVLVIVPDASPPELQALGGIAGVVAMVNYFLSPVYVFGYSLALRAGRVVSSS